MMICPKCHNVMKHVYRFTPDKSCELNICKNVILKQNQSALNLIS